MDFSYLTNVMTALQPLLTRALPVVGASIVFSRLYSLIKR